MPELNTKHGTPVDVQDDKEPDAFDLELLLEPQRVANNHLEPNIQAMAELDDIQGLLGDWSRGLMRQALSRWAPARRALSPKLRKHSARSAADSDRIPNC